MTVNNGSHEYEYFFIKHNKYKEIVPSNIIRKQRGTDLSMLGLRGESARLRLHVSINNNNKTQ